MRRKVKKPSPDLYVAWGAQGKEAPCVKAREYYAHEFLAYRRVEPTPYMDGLRFDADGGRDADKRVLSDRDLEQAVEAGKAKTDR